MSESKLRFSLARHLIILPVYVNDHGPFGFILDTGAGQSMLSKHAVKRLRLKSSPLREKGLGAGGTVALQYTVVDSLKLADIRLKNREVRVIDQSRISKAVGRRIYGIIGCDVLCDYVITIDYKKRDVVFRGGRRSGQTKD